MNSPLKPFVFFVPLLFTAIFAFLSVKGVVKAELLLSEQLGSKTFELFTYISLVLTGLVGVFHIRAKELIFHFVCVGATWIANFIFGLGGSLVGWGVGLLVATVAMTTLSQFVAHTGIVCCMVIMVLLPSWAFEQMIATREVAKERFFRRNLYGTFVRFILFLVGGLGVYGFWQFWA